MIVTQTRQKTCFVHVKSGGQTLFFIQVGVIWPFPSRASAVYAHGKATGTGIPAGRVEIFGAGRVRVRVSKSATGTGRVAEMVDPHTSNAYPLYHQLHQCIHTTLEHKLACLKEHIVQHVFTQQTQSAVLQSSSLDLCIGNAWVSMSSQQPRQVRTWQFLLWCRVTMTDLTGMQPQQQQSMCGPTVHAPTHTCRPSGLLIVHAMLTLAAKAWLCSMTRT